MEKVKYDKLKNDFPIVIFAGVIGAGKTTASKYIAHNYNFKHLSYVNLIWFPILNERELEYSRENLQNLGDELREKFGIEELAKLIIPFVPDDVPAVIDDIRHPDAYKSLKEYFSRKIYLIYIKTDTNQRVARLKIRDNLSSALELEEIEKRKTEETIQELEPFADFIIVNNRSINKFHKLIDNCLSKIGIVK